MREHARFVYQRGSCDMRNHESGFHSGLLRQKCRKTLALIWIHRRSMRRSLMLIRSVIAIAA